MTDNLVELESLLDKLPEAVERQKFGDRLSESIETLRNADNQIARLSALLDLADLTGYGETEAQREGLGGLQKEAFEVGEALETASTDDQLRDAVYDYQGSFRQALNGADTLLRNHWSSLAAERFQSLRLLGELLERIGVAEDLGRRMQDCGRRGVASSRATHLTDLTPNARSLLKELAALQEERARTIGVGDIGDFINALAESRATLAMVTPAVHAWLADNQALERFSLAPS